MLYRFRCTGSISFENKIQHPYHADGTELEPSEQLNLRHFSQKLEDLHAKFITKGGKPLSDRAAHASGNT